MADENEKKITVQALPKCVDESAQALILPAATETGSFLADLLYHLTGKVHLSAEKMRAKNAHDLNVFKEELARELSTKPAECLTEPKQQVVAQAFEQAKNCLEEEEIRKMFEKLIANASDIRYQASVHPSFPSMVAQMSPLDAENLSLFYPNRRLPIVNYFLHLKEGGNVPIFENCFLDNPKMYTKSDLELQAASIDSLRRQGIIGVNYMSRLNKSELYDKFLRSAPMCEAQNILAHPNSVMFKGIWPHADKVDFEKGIVELTPLGKNFVKVCFDS